MNEAYLALTRLEAAGATLHLKPDGQVLVSTRVPLPPGLIEAARPHRKAIRALLRFRLAEQTAQPLSGEPL